MQGFGGLFADDVCLALPPPPEFQLEIATESVVGLQPQSPTKIPPASFSSIFGFLVFSFRFYFACEESLSPVKV